MANLRKFSSQADAEVIEGIQEIAAREGRQFQAVLGEAMKDYVARKRRGEPRRHVLEAFEQSMHEYEELYRLLAK